MKQIKYNGVVLEIPSEKPTFTHSLPLMYATSGKLEGNHNIPYFERLMQYKETDLPEGELLHEVCALYSIKNLNYQVCNGGFHQYFYNGYHKYKAGYNIGDISHLEIKYQIEFLEKLTRFILLNEDKQQYKTDLIKALLIFKEMPNSIKKYDGVTNADASLFNELWYKVSSVVEWGIELYAQYLIKRLEEMKIGNTNK